MALTDILIDGGHNDYLLVEIPLGILNAPIDILFSTSILEIPLGVLNAPDDILFHESTFTLEIPQSSNETFTVFAF